MARAAIRALGVLLVGLAAPALADPPPPDVDAAEEARSDFWERIKRPRGEAFDAAVRRAQILLESSSGAQVGEAEALLLEAADLEPHNPLAWWWLGELYARQEKWSACAEARSRVFALDPGFRSPSPRDDPGAALDLGLGVCLAHAGDFERSMVHLKRVLADGGSPRYDVHWRLGNSLMALGRLGEAIEAYQAAYRAKPGYDYAMLNFVLAVAYDRDEQVAQSRAELEEGLRRDPRLGTLTTPPVAYLPAADEDYYLGLASRAQGRRSWALVYFRRYLDRAPDSPWAARARSHLAELGRLPMSGDEISVRGPAPVDRKQVEAAVLRARGALERCLADTPNLLVRIRATVPARPGRGKRGRKPAAPPARTTSRALRLGELDPPPGGVRATREIEFATRGDAVGHAVECIEEVARRITWPQPVGDPSAFALIELHLAAP